MSSQEMPKEMAQKAISITENPRQWFAENKLRAVGVPVCTDLFHQKLPTFTGLGHDRGMQTVAALVKGVQSSNACL